MKCIAHYITVQVLQCRSSTYIQARMHACHKLFLERKILFTCVLQLQSIGFVPMLEQILLRMQL